MGVAFGQSSALAPVGTGYPNGFSFSFAKATDAMRRTVNTIQNARIIASRSCRYAYQMGQTDITLTLLFLSPPS